MKSILIVDLATYIPQGTIGGVEIVIVNMAKVLAGAGYHVTVLNSIESSEQEALVNSNNIDCVSMNMAAGTELRYKVLKRLVNVFGTTIPSRYYYNNRVLQKVKALFNTEHFNLIISNRLDDLPLLLTANKAQLPLIQMLHGNPQWAMAYWHGLRKGIGVSLKKVSLLQVLLPSYAKDMRQVYAGDICVIPNTVQLVSDEELSTSTKRKQRIIYVARHAREKRLELLIEAFEKIAGKFPAWYVDCYGTTTDKGYVNELQKEINRRGLHRQFVLQGYNDDVYTINKQAAICAFPSAGEGFGLALLEAMTCGLPIVGFKQARGVNEIIIDNVNGFLVADVQELAAKLSLLMEDAELRVKMGYEAHASAKKYAAGVVWPQWLKIIEKYAK